MKLHIITKLAIGTFLGLLGYTVWEYTKELIGPSSQNIEATVVYEFFPGYTATHSDDGTVVSMPLATTPKDTLDGVYQTYVAAFGPANMLDNRPNTLRFKWDGYPVLLMTVGDTVVVSHSP